MVKQVYVCDECGTHHDDIDELAECCHFSLLFNPKGRFHCRTCHMHYSDITEAYTCCEQPQPRWECEDCGASHEAEEDAEFCSCKDDDGSYATGGSK